MFKKPNLISHYLLIGNKKIKETIYFPSNRELAIYYINHKSSQEFTALMDYFKIEKVNLNTLYDDYGDSLIHICLLQKTNKKLVILLQYEIDINLTNADNLTALQTSLLFSTHCKQSHTKLLLEKGAHIGDLIYQLVKEDKYLNALQLLKKYNQIIPKTESISEMSYDNLMDNAYKNNASKNYNFLLKYSHQSKEKLFLSKNLKKKFKITSNIKKI